MNHDHASSKSFLGLERSLGITYWLRRSIIPKILVKRTTPTFAGGATLRQVNDVGGKDFAREACYGEGGRGASDWGGEKIFSGKGCEECNMGG